MKAFLQGARILFICPNFHHYHRSIQKQLEKLGAIVYRIPTFKPTVAHKFFPPTEEEIDRYYTRHFSKYKGLTMTHLFQIRGEDIGLKHYTPFISSGTRLIMFQWDSLRNYDYTAHIPLFNSVFSFDPVDCRMHPELIYSTNFHEIDEIRHMPPAYDVLIIGGLAYWRYDMVLRFYQLAKRNDLSCFFKLKAPFKTILKAYANGKILNPKLITLKSISLEKYKSLLFRSKVILDVPNPDQTGLSMRSIDALAAKKKLITTNKQIVNEPFYSPKNVLLIEADLDENRVVAFIKSGEKDDVDMREYHIENWIKKIFINS